MERLAPPSGYKPTSNYTTDGRWINGERAGKIDVVTRKATAVRTNEGPRSKNDFVMNFTWCGISGRKALITYSDNK
ncbi:MAG: hypothetical protein VB878_21080 [Pirellulaceae bacterium]